MNGKILMDHCFCLCGKCMCMCMCVCVCVTRSGECISVGFDFIQMIVITNNAVVVCCFMVTAGMELCIIYFVISE